MFGKRNQVKREKIGDGKSSRLVSFSRLFNTPKHGCATSDVDSQAPTYNRMSLPQEQLNLDLARDRALTYLRSHMIK